MYPFISWQNPFVQCSILIGMIVTIAVGKGSFADEAPQKLKENQAPVALRISVVMDAPVTTLSFTLTNNSDKERAAIPVDVDPSHIVVEKPTGEKVEMFSAVGAINVGSIKPSESATWKRDIGREFRAYDLMQPGLYRVYWSLIEWKDEKTKVEYKSNDVYLLIGDKAQQEKAKK